MPECDWCGGTGFISQGLGSETCPECLGTGEVEGGEENSADGPGSIAYIPKATRIRAPSTKGEVASGFGCGCLMGLLSLMMGIGLAGIPVFGWILATGFIGAALLWPLIGAWAGAKSGGAL